MAVILLLLGCLASPPAIQAAAPSTTPAPLTRDGEGPGGSPRVRGDLTVEQAVDLALRYNLAIALARSQEAAARADVLQASSDGRLKLSLNGFLVSQSGTMIYNTPPGVDPAFTTLLPRPGAADANAMAMLPLFNGGMLRQRLAAAREAERGATARVAVALWQSTREARVAYYAVEMEKARLAIALWRRGQLAEALRVTRKQLEVGRVARYVVLRAEAEAAAADQQINDLHAAIAGREAELKRALGVAQDSQFAYVDPPPAVSLPTREETLTHALADRPDLAAARAGEAEAVRRVAEARARSAPQGYLVGAYEGMKPGPFNGAASNHTFSVGLVVSVPILDGGARRAEVDRARAGQGGRALEIRSLEQDVDRQVTVAWNDLDAARRNLDLALTEVDRAEEDLRVAHLRYTLGRGIYLELLDAVTAASRARLNQANAAWQAATAQANLLYVTGR